MQKTTQFGSESNKSVKRKSFPWNYDLMNGHIVESCLAFEQLRSAATKCPTDSPITKPRCSIFGNFLTSLEHESDSFDDQITSDQSFQIVI